VTAPGGYTRTEFRAPVSAPLTGQDAAELIGSEMTVNLRGVAIAGGVVVDCRNTSDGRHLLITVEAHGRSCPACGRVYRDDEADNRLAPLSVLRESWVGRYPASLPVYADLPAWVRVCTAWADCEHHRRGNDPAR
jgi:hypothetical protein